MDLEFLTRKARQIRRQVFEKVIASGNGHLGGTYSCTDLLVAMYYGAGLNFDRNDPTSKSADTFIMGKGHACLALYFIFNDLGWISSDRLKEYGQNGGSLGGQLDNTVPSVQYNTGSLGHALGICAGQALAARLDGAKTRAVAMMGDGECDEGSVWEAVFFAGRERLSNLTAIVDRNRLSVTDVRAEDDVVFSNFTNKMNSFGWNCIEINGHSFADITRAFEMSKSTDKPLMILANTIKGKGISFMENETKWHHSLPSQKEIELARKELAD